MDGLNNRFISDPANFLANNIIYMPERQNETGVPNLFYYPIRNNVFDLHFDVKEQHIVLTTMDRRGKLQGPQTHIIPGDWLPLREGPSEYRVNATGNPYFIFTDRLGGCSIGIKEINEASTTFIHDPNEEPGWVNEYQLHLSPAEYGNKTNVNTTGIAYWDGNKWDIVHCNPYSILHPDQKKLVEQDFYIFL